jgi:hypothetical protein
VPLDQFAFSLAPLSIAFASGFRDDPAAWQFVTLAPTPTHIISMAVRHGGTNPVGVASYQVTPSDIDRLMAATPAGGSMGARE